MVPPERVRAATTAGVAVVSVLILVADRMQVNHGAPAPGAELLHRGREKD
jgi:hypothetical protein